MLSAWIKLANVVADQLLRFRRSEIFSNLPEVVTVNVGVDGGVDINFWPVIERSDSAPVL